MESDVCHFVLRNTLNEMANASPDIKSIFLFREDGDIISDEKTREEAAVHTVDVLDEILEKAEALGGLECISFEGAKGTVRVSHLNEFYLVIVVPEKADMKRIEMFAGILVPTILKLLERITPALDSPPKLENERSEGEPFIKSDKPSADIADKREADGPAQASLEKVPPKPQVDQFIVENAQSLFASPDTVRIDGDILSLWMELYEDKRIEEVTVETFGGKSVRCRLKPLKDWKLEGKNVIQIPPKIQERLNVKKGELVRVKPVVE